MSAALRIDARTETYNDLKKMISGLAYRYAIKHGEAFTEYLSLANLTFLKCFEWYDDSKKVLFSSFVYQRTILAFTDHQREKVRKHRQQERHMGQQTTTEVDATADKRNPFFLVDLIDELTEDGKTVAMMTLQSMEVRHALFDTPATKKTSDGAIRRHTRQALQDVLSDLGWTASRIRETFEEIADALSS